jgi:type IV secretion system protein VirD4
MSLLRKMTVIGGLGLDIDVKPEKTPGAPEPGVIDNALTSSLSSAGHAIVANGGGYALAAGGGLGLCAIAGINPMFDLLVAGGCGYHAMQRALESLTWMSSGGWLAQRRRRKYQGEANPWEVAQTLSPAFAAKKMQRLAPDLPAVLSFLPLGVTVHRPRQQVAVSRAESVAVFGVPQSLKTALISGWILEAPGPVLATSSRADQWRHTVTEREKMGEVLVLDADGFGPGTNFAWSPVAGCEDPVIAQRRAGALMDASPKDPGGKDKWHEARGMDLLQFALHAAALAGEGMYAVRAWCRDPGEPEFMKALQLPQAALDWDSELMDLCSQEGDFLASATTSAAAALRWMNDPSLAMVACPSAGQGIDIGQFLAAGNGTVYLIGSEKPYGSLTPYFSAFVSEFLEQARILAERQGGRLRNPLTMAIDETATTARIDLKRWLAVTAGYNITMVTGFQAVQQIEEGWGGPAAAEVILEMLSTKVIAGGFTSPSTLERLSVICGHRDTWRKEGHVKVPDRELVFPPERLRQLPQFNALVVQRSAKPVQVRVQPVWEHPAHQEVRLTDAPEQDAPAATEE